MAKMITDGLYPSRICRVKDFNGGRFIVVIAVDKAVVIVVAVIVVDIVVIDVVVIVIVIFVSVVGFTDDVGSSVVVVG